MKRRRARDRRHGAIAGQDAEFSHIAAHSDYGPKGSRDLRPLAVPGLERYAVDRFAVVWRVPGAPGREAVPLTGLLFPQAMRAWVGRARTGFVEFVAPGAWRWHREDAGGARALNTWGNDDLSGFLSRHQGTVPALDPGRLSTVHSKAAPYWFVLHFDAPRAAWLLNGTILRAAIAPDELI